MHSQTHTCRQARLPLQLIVLHDTLPAALVIKIRNRLQLDSLNGLRLRFQGPQSSFCCAHVQTTSGIGQRWRQQAEARPGTL